MKRHLGFSLAETIVVMSILVLATAVLSPVFFSVKKNTSINVSVGRMHQLHLAVFLYQQDNDLRTDVPPQLPPRSYVYTTYLDLGERFFVSPCGYVDGIDDNLKRLSYQYWYLPPRTDDYYAEYLENAMLFIDPHCNTPEQWHSHYRHKRGIGVTVSGSLINHYKAGSPAYYSWWTSPPDH